MKHFPTISYIFNLYQPILFGRHEWIFRGLFPQAEINFFSLSSRKRNPSSRPIDKSLFIVIFGSVFAYFRIEIVGLRRKGNSSMEKWEIFPMSRDKFFSPYSSVLFPIVYFFYELMSDFMSSITFLLRRAGMVGGNWFENLITTADQNKADAEGATRVSDDSNPFQLTRMIDSSRFSHDFRNRKFKFQF